MKKNPLALLRTFMFVALMPMLSLSLVGCNPDEGTGDAKGDEAEVNNSSTAPAGVKAVDLGLSVKWANCNVGAESPEEFGDYFAWGETVPKERYYESNSIAWDLPITELESLGIIGTDGNLTVAYDAATVNWGGDWRMPTINEILELCNICTWQWITQNGVKGYKVTGSNGNSIFLPAAGMFYGSVLGYKGLEGDYWSATPCTEREAYCLTFRSDYYLQNEDGDSEGFYWGKIVRPVSE